MEGGVASVYYYKTRSRLGRVVCACDPGICRVKQFKASLGYTARPYCKREGKKEKGKKGGRREERKMYKKNTEIEADKPTHRYPHRRTPIPTVSVGAPHTASWTNLRSLCVLSTWQQALGTWCTGKAKAVLLQPQFSFTR